VGVVENMKDVADLVKRFNDIELNRRILTLETEVLDLSRDKRRLEEKVEQMEKSLKLRNDLYFHEPFYWVKGDSIPYCASCWETQTAAIHVIFGHDSNEGYSAWQCPGCKHTCYPKQTRQSLISSAAKDR